MISEKEEGKYCGFLCSDMTEKQQEIVNEIAELRKVNPEFAAEFTGRMMDMLMLRNRQEKE
jgi:hypothetical protein